MNTDWRNLYSFGPSPLHSNPCRQDRGGPVGGGGGDGDGHVNELAPALIDHMELDLLNYFKPGKHQQNAYTREGRHLLRDMGCTECHRPSFTIEQDRWVADVETDFDPNAAAFNRLFATATPLFEEIDDGSGEPPLRSPLGGSFRVKNIFTDFERHDLGPGFWERNYDGTITKEFMTEPLWGVESTPPYGHDGRTISLKEVILRHGGEAQASRDDFAEASLEEQMMVFAFLDSLVLFPPDDTASNLNAGATPPTLISRSAAMAVSPSACFSSMRRKGNNRSTGTDE